jgi:hypothetical protein
MATLMSNHMITTQPKVTLCRCGATILFGYAEGLPVRADPIPLNQAGLLAAILTQRGPWRLTRTGLVYLYDYRIQDTTIQGPNLISHQCDAMPPPQHRKQTQQPTQKNNDDGIPF